MSCLSCFLQTPSQSGPVNIFHIYLRFISWRVSDVSGVHTSSEDASRLLVSRERSPFHSGVDAFPHWVRQRSGGNRLQRHANTKTLDLGPFLKFMKRRQCPLVNLRHDHTTSAVSVPRCSYWNKYIQIFFMLFPFLSLGSESMLYIILIWI